MATRPDPEELLRQIQAKEAHDSRGRLKIFLGYAPRVGKSLRMFDEGRRRHARGQDVVIGAIQPRGAEDLKELIGEFEVIPPMTIGGADSMDIDAVVRRQPHVCLVDELARENPPGSRYAHRWQDVEELRDRGVNVVGAINLQHIAEQQPVVERITGKRSENSVPESFIHSADEIVIVDVPAQDLQHHGQGVSNLSPAQLSELREAALLLAAQVVERQLQRYMDNHGIRQGWGTQERILVCVTTQKTARAMLESGARAAERFHGQLLTISVKSREFNRADEEALEQNLAYARKLGAEVHVVEGRDPIAEIIRFAREQRITQIFVGHTRQPAWKVWAASPVQRLIGAAEGMDVRIFPQAA